jgi:flagellar biosynthetic protein FliR
MLENIAIETIFHFALIFGRIGAAMMFLPGLGESYVNAKTKLGFSFLLCAIIFPLVSPMLPKLPSDVYQMAFYLVMEITVGVLFGTLIRIVQSVLHISGMIIAFQTGLSTAMLFDPNQSSQGSVIGGFLTITALALIFATNMHHLIIMGLVDSYKIIDLSQGFPVEDFVKHGTYLVGQCFVVSFKISAPLIISGLIVYLVAGIISKLMPSFQIFFIMMPVQIAVGFIFFALSLSAIMMAYSNFFEENILKFVNPQ